MPLAFAPGERAEFDFGHGVIELDRHEISQPFLAGRLRYSGAMFVEVFPTERQVSFLLGQRRLGSALAQAVASYHPRHGLVNNTEHGDNEVVQVHGALLRSMAMVPEES